MKRVQIAGKLYIPGLPNVYYLLHPYPVAKDGWQSDDTNTFHVAIDGSVARHIVVKGPYVIDYGEAGYEISLKEETFEIDEELLPPDVAEELFNPRIELEKI